MQLTIICTNGSGPVQYVRVHVTDKYQNNVYEGLSGRDGKCALPDLGPGEYRIRAAAPCIYSPRTQNRWILFPADGEGYAYFCFQQRRKQPTGSLTVLLRDQSYPEHALEKGEITLWRGLK